MLFINATDSLKKVGALVTKECGWADFLHSLKQRKYTKLLMEKLQNTI